MKIVKLFLISIIILIAGCGKKEIVYKVDYDFSNVKFSQIKSISYFGEHIGPRNVLYFYTDNLTESLDLIRKEKGSLIELITARTDLGGLDETIITKYFSKGDILALIFYKDNKRLEQNNVVYRAIIIPIEDGDTIGLTKYMIDNKKMYPAEFTKEELDVMNKIGIREATFERYSIYKFKGEVGDIAFEGDGIHWKIVRVEPKNIFGYVFNTFLVKSDIEKYGDISYYVVPGLDYLCDTYVQVVNKINQITQTHEIFIPELGLYWNSKLPGKYYVDYKEVKASLVTN